MRQDMVRIGNSRGIRIPKLLIEQCNLGDTVDLRVENNCLIISPDRKPRQGWGDAFQASGPDSLILEGMPANRFDRDEWEW